MRLKRIRQHKVILLVVLLTFFSQYSYAQCTNQHWDMSNIGSAYIESVGNKAVYGNFTNISDAQFVNDGRLYFFNDITNDGHIGDGFGYEYIKTCDSLRTTIKGEGTTEFNVVDIDNPGDIDVALDMRIKANLHFANGTIHTDRNEFRDRVFFLQGATYSGSSNDRHVDGTIARQGQGSFVFPLGDGDHLSQLKATGENAFDIFVATYHSILQTDEQYTSKGEFSLDSKDLDVSRVHPREFWTLSGGQSTRVSLYWSVFSEINDFVEDVENLVIVGWDGEKWVNLGNTGVIETFNTGSITSRSIIPNRYDAFTFGIVDEDGDGYVDTADPAPTDPCIPDATTEACINRVCVDVQLSVFLEGPLQSGRIGEYADEMSTTLNQFGYLPGQRPITLLGTPTSAGQPYGREPWFYTGTEGLEFDAFRDGVSQLYPSDAVDWILVSLRTEETASSTVCTKSALLLTDGSILLTEYFDCCEMMIADEYYIVIEHRNHLAIMTPTPMPVVNGIVTYDFRENQTFTRLFGNGQKEVKPGVYAMYAGNGDQFTAPESPKDINSNDVSLWARDNGFHSGYYLQDYNLSGDVNVHDKAIWLVNNGVFTDVDR